MAAPDHAQQPAPRIFLRPRGRPHVTVRHAGPKPLAARASAGATGMSVGAHVSSMKTEALGGSRSGWLSTVWGAEDGFGL